jgi:hypothetical protein
LFRNGSANVRLSGCAKRHERWQDKAKFGGKAVLVFDKRVFRAKIQDGMAKRNRFSTPG